MRGSVASIHSGFDSKHAITACVAVSMTILALAYGGYGTDWLSALAFVIWGVVLVGIGFGQLPRARLATSALIGLALMTGLTAYAAIAISWSDDAGLAYISMIQIASAAGIFVLAILLAKPGEGLAWIRGITLGFLAIVLLAAISRFFPGIGSDADLTIQLGNIIGGRLSWPLGYWNAIGVATACLLVLCLWHGGHASTRYVRLAATAVTPIASVVMYMCSSRGSLVAAFIGIAVVISLGPRRQRLFGTLIIGILGAVPLVLLNAKLPEVVHAGTGSDAVFQGLVLLAAVVLVGALSCWLRGPLIRRLESANFKHRTTIRIAIVLGIAVVALVFASDPGERISAFTALPVNGIESDGSTFATDHLLSESSNGRWQLWESAIDAFASSPLYGIGSGGYEAWFKENGTFWMKTVEPHSLPLLFLSELGLIGFFLLAGSLFFGLYTGINRYRSLGRGRGGSTGGTETEVGNKNSNERSEMAAFMGLLAVGTFAFSIDWTGDFPVLFGPIMISIAVLVGPVYSRAAAPAINRRPTPTLIRMAVVVGALVFSGAVMIASARQFEASRNIAASRAAFEDGDGGKALEKAERAVSATPWAGDAYGQLAAVQERVVGPALAVATAEEATRRSPKNDSLWLLRSSIQVNLGLKGPSYYSALIAQLLNPRSQYWSPPEQ